MNLEDAMGWLVDAELIHLLHLVQKNRFRCQIRRISVLIRCICQIRGFCAEG